MEFTRKKTFEGVEFNLIVDDSEISLFSDEKQMEKVATYVIPEQCHKVIHDGGQIEEFCEPERTETDNPTWHKYSDALLVWGNEIIKSHGLPEIDEGDYCDADWNPSFRKDVSEE